MADALRVYVGESSEELVCVQLDLEDGHGGLHLVEVARGAVDGLGDVLLDQVEVDLILLGQAVSRTPMGGMGEGTHSLAVGVVEGLQLDDIGMSHDAHDL